MFLGKVPQHMNIRRTVITLLCSLIVGVGLPMTVQAALEGRLPATPGGTDYQAYYDTDLNIMWLGDANLATTNSFGLPQSADELPSLDEIGATGPGPRSATASH